jgi:hypothetical protein
MKSIGRATRCDIWVAAITLIAALVHPAGHALSPGPCHDDAGCGDTRPCTSGVSDCALCEALLKGYTPPEAPPPLAHIGELETPDVTVSCPDLASRTRTDRTRAPPA